VSGTAVLDVMHTLDTTQGKFYALALANLSSSPGQVLQLTADWVKTQPKVKNVFFFDSTYIDIEMNSGLRSTFMINLVDKDSLSLSRGSGSKIQSGRITPGVKANNAIKNKSVLIYIPFTNGKYGKFYSAGELEKIVSII